MPHVQFVTNLSQQVDHVEEHTKQSLESLSVLKIRQSLDPEQIMTTTTTTRTQSIEFFARTERQDMTNSGLRRAPTIRAKSMPTRSRQSGSRSPTDTGSSSDTETEFTTVPASASRGRSLDKDLEHKLHEAVSSIKVTRSLSPELQARAPEPSSVIPSLVVVCPSNTTTPDHEIPRSMHTKSASVHEFGAAAAAAATSSNSCAVLETEETTSFRPHRMVRKKSGELVRSSLKMGAKGRRPASMPSTPGYTKNVHFDRKLEHVRHFLYTEKPAAVSANTSPTQEYASSSEFPFRSNDSFEHHELTIELPNFVQEAQQTDNEGAIIKVETVYLSTDKKSLIGRVAVRNLAFQKYVCVRYTLDDWRTTSETAAEYTQDVRKKHRDDAFDRFCFKIKIDDFVGVTDKTMFFCVRYNTAGQDYWDSNGGQNFRVEFHKRSSSRRGKSGPPSMAPMRRASVDDIPVRGSDIDSSQTQSPMKTQESLIFENIYDNFAVDDQDHERPIKVKTIGKKGGSTDSFSNRYDFGASLSAAIAAANSMLQGSGDEIKPKVEHEAEHIEHVNFYNPYFSAEQNNKFNSGTVSPTFPPALDSSNCDTPNSSGDVSPIPGLSSRISAQGDKAQAYQSLLDNYCFVWK